MSDATVHPNEPLGFVDAEPAEPVGNETQENAVSRADRARNAGYRSRFVALYVGLGLVAVVGVGAFVVSIVKDDAATSTPVASQFTPSRVGELGAVELAENVQRKYRLATGDELVGVVASRNTLQDGNLGLIRVRYQLVQPLDSASEKDSKVITPRDAIQFSLCGTGTACAIPGKASAARFALLKREALELAIRTFQNDSSVDNVSVFLRPVPPTDASFEGYTLMFDRAELNRNEPGLISRPLRETLPGAKKTITTAELRPAHLKQIDSLTRSYLYQYRYQLLGGRDALMQLQPAKS